MSFATLPTRVLVSNQTARVALALDACGDAKMPGTRARRRLLLDEMSAGSRANGVSAV